MIDVMGRIPKVIGDRAAPELRKALLEPEVRKSLGGYIAPDSSGPFATDRTLSKLVGPINGIGSPFNIAGLGLTKLASPSRPIMLDGDNHPSRSKWLKSPDFSMLGTS